VGLFHSSCCIQFDRAPSNVPHSIASFFCCILFTELAVVLVLSAVWPFWFVVGFVHYSVLLFPFFSYGFHFHCGLSTPLCIFFLLSLGVFEGLLWLPFLMGPPGGRRRGPEYLNFSFQGPPPKIMRSVTREGPRPINLPSMLSAFHNVPMCRL